MTTTGQAVVAFVVLRSDLAVDHSSEDAATILWSHVSTATGSIVRPRHAIIVVDLPKTRSGKGMKTVSLASFHK